MKKRLHTLLSFLLLGAMLALAFPPQPVLAQSKASTGYFLLTQNKKSLSVCVGQTLHLDGEFFSDPLIRGRAIAGSLIASARLGTISPGKTFVSGVRGPYGLTYQARKAGTDQIRLELRDDKIRSSVLVEETFPILVEENCEYFMSVNGILVSEHQAGEYRMEQHFQLLLNGIVQQQGSDPVRYHFEPKSLNMYQYIPVFNVPDCKNLTPVPGTAKGTYDGFVETVPESGSIRVALFDVSMRTQLEMKVGCTFPDSGSMEGSRSAVFNFNYGGGIDDPWIEGVFPSEGGEVVVNKMEPFEKYKKNLSISGKASYKVTMKLRRLKSQ